MAQSYFLHCRMEKQEKDKSYVYLDHLKPIGAAGIRISEQIGSQY